MAKKEKDNDFDLNFGEDTSAEAEKEEAPVPSTFHSNLLTKNINEIPMCDIGSLKLMKFKVEADEDYIEGSVFCLCKLAPSEIRVLFKLSHIETKLDGDYGWARYRTRKRQNIEADFQGFNTPLAAEEAMKLDSMEGISVVFTAKNDGQKGDYIEGYFVYSKM